MTSLIHKLICDHEDFVKIRLFQASILLPENSIEWTRIKNSLESKYKYTLDLQTFSEPMGTGIKVLPYIGEVFKNTSSVLDLYVRYTCEHEQDAAFHQMLIYGLPTKGIATSYDSLVIPGVSHRFLYPGGNTFAQVNGLIKINCNELQLIKPRINKVIDNWKHIKSTMYNNQLSYDNYHSFLETLDEQA